MSVYAIECAGLLKIGYSTDPDRRVAALFQSGSRYSAPRAAYEARGTQRLVAVIDKATKQDERAIHWALDEYSIGCEWFLDEPEVRELLASFTLGDQPEPIGRDGGPAWEATPPGDRGGANVGLAVSVLAKRAAS